MTGYASAGNHYTPIIGFAQVIIIVVFTISGCAPLPPVEEERAATPHDEERILTEAQRDSIILVKQSFAFERWKAGEWVTAKAHYDTIRFYDTTHSRNIYRTLADCYVHLGMLDSAQIAYEEGIQYFPDDEYLHNSLAIMYRNQNRLDEAVDQIQQAIRINPEKTEHWRELADLHVKIGDTEAAIVTLEKLSSLLPDDKGIYEQIVQMKKLHRSPDEYLQELQQLVKKFPDDPSKRFEYGAAMLEMGKNAKAAEEFETYTKMRPDDAAGWRSLAQALDDLGKYREAIRARSRAVELEPDALRDMIAIGQDYLSLKNWMEARSWGKRALGRDADFGPAHVLFGDVYFRMADDASGERPKYEDKLAFTIAYGLYERAASSADPRARDDGERAMRNLRNSELVPSKEERFMNKRKNRPTGEAYTWINSDWPEVQYIDKFLEGLDD